MRSEPCTRDQTSVELNSASRSEQEATSRLLIRGICETALLLLCKLTLCGFKTALRGSELVFRSKKPPKTETNYNPK